MNRLVIMSLVLGLGIRAMCECIANQTKRALFEVFFFSIIFKRKWEGTEQ